MHPGKRVCALFAACIAIAAATTATAAPAPVKHLIVPYTLKSGPLVNRSAGETVSYTEVVNGGDVPWIRLGFGHVQLAQGSRLQIESLEDGAKQTLDARALAQWQNTSAYFNGNAVRISVITAAGSRNSVEVDRLIVGEAPISTESQCGATDDRVPSAEPARARLLNIGCTASIYNEQSCMITAGHCLSTPSFVNVVEFNVPKSRSNGALRHPGPEDQYTPTNHRQFVDGGIGNDWGLFEVNPNTETGLLPFEAQGEHLTLRTSLPPVNTRLRVVGYGVDFDQLPRTQTQQTNAGPLIAINGTGIEYRIDTEGGNSGSAVTVASDDSVVGIHTHSGCETPGQGNNGTAITLPSLQTALANFCPGP
jgi:V8-like Glu-specific endopeptidase